VQHEPNSPTLTGLVVAVAIVAIWIVSLVVLLAINIDRFIPFGILTAILVRTFIQTGLFVVAHDAIHGSVMPGHVRINHWLGRSALMLYALLPYRQLSLNHWQHHRYPGQVGDPDFHDGIHSQVVLWYLKFMSGYLDRRQRVVLFFGMKAIFFTLYLGFHVAIPNLFLFWVLPIVLSSIQLFVFGTYLPHRSTAADEAAIYSPHRRSGHHATSSNYSPFWSFLTCYHFGYHWEHHEYPSVPWYGLPSVRQVPEKLARANIYVSKSCAGNQTNHN
jgi:beta-carotene/zeaxanthin 4-ketolase